MAHLLFLMWLMAGLAEEAAGAAEGVAVGPLGWTQLTQLQLARQKVEVQTRAEAEAEERNLLL